MTKDPLIHEAWNKVYDDIKVLPGRWDDTEQVPDSQKASTYQNLHKNIFETYWMWREFIDGKFNKYEHLTLSDGWSLLKDRDHSTRTVTNFPIQGAGAAILRLAVKYCILEGLEVFATLHDAIYIISKEEDVEADKATLSRLMRKASAEVIGEDIVRVDAEAYVTDWDNLTSTWTKDKGYDDLKEFGELFTKKKNMIEQIIN